MEDIKSFVEECIANAKVAMNHQKFKEAKEFLMPAYEKVPDNTEVLQMLGGICILLGEFKEALTHYNKIVALEPDKGDSYYMLGNAFFTNAQYKNAFDAYIKAEELGCSKEILARLYYQMALLCSIKGDMKAALFHFQQYEDTDPTGMAALDETYLSERLKIHIREKDAENAVKYARLLLNVKPENYEYYGLIFNLLMVDKKYDEAEQILAQAEKYLKLNYEQRVDMAVQKATLYTEQANSDAEHQNEYLQKACSVIAQVRNDTELTVTNNRELILMTAETYLKGKFYQEARQLAESLVADLPLQEVPSVGSVAEKQEAIRQDSRFWATMTTGDIQDAEYRQQMAAIQSNPTRMQAVLEEDLSKEQASVTGDVSQGDMAETARIRKIIEEMANQKEDYRIMPEGQFNDRLNTVLISCYLEANEFDYAGQYAAFLKESDNASRANFGYYVSAVSQQKLASDGKVSKEAAEDEYNKAIAHFKKRMFEDATDTSAAIFRTRLYAENGKYALAEQTAKMLDDTTMQSLNKYIATCRQTEGSNG